MRKSIALIFSVLLVLIIYMYKTDGLVSLCQSDFLWPWEISTYKAAASKDDAASAKSLYMHYSMCGESEKSDLWLLKAASLGDANSQYIYGQKLLRKKNKEEGRTWLERALNKGDFFAAKALASSFEEDGNFSNAHSYYMLAAKNNDVSSMLKLGDFYSAGLGVPQDISAASKWYKGAQSLSEKESLYWSEAERKLDGIKEKGVSDN